MKRDRFPLCSSLHLFVFSLLLSLPHTHNTHTHTRARAIISLRVLSFSLTCEWVISYTHKWVMSHAWMSHVTHMQTYVTRSALFNNIFESSIALFCWGLFYVCSLWVHECVRASLSLSLSLFLCGVRACVCLCVRIEQSGSRARRTRCFLCFFVSLKERNPT